MIHTFHTTIITNKHSKQVFTTRLQVQLFLHNLLFLPQTLAFHFSVLICNITLQTFEQFDNPNSPLPSLVQITAIIFKNVNFDAYAKSVERFTLCVNIGIFLYTGYWTFINIFVQRKDRYDVQKKSLFKFYFWC